MRWCARCLYPDTKPDLFIDEEGVCSACRNYEHRAEADWKAREQEFIRIVEQNRSNPVYDCIVPVSGGKDSHYQIWRLKSLGFNPLAVTAMTCDLSDLGARNLDNISQHCDHITVTSSRDVRRQLNRFCLETIGDISWPEHVSIFTVPVKIAVQSGIRLIVWGECPQNEYGGPAADATTLDRAWLEEYGGLLGMRVADLPFPAKRLEQYTYPSLERLNAANVNGVFLGQFFPWDGCENYQIAQTMGFEDYGRMVEGSCSGYENLDNYQTGIHDWFKFLKLGFGRATDIACNHVRRGRWSRSFALDVVADRDGMFPESYLGKGLDDILGELKMSRDQFLNVADQFRNKKLIDRDYHLMEDRRGHRQHAQNPHNSCSIASGRKSGQGPTI